MLVRSLRGGAKGTSAVAAGGLLLAAGCAEPAPGSREQVRDEHDAFTEDANTEAGRLVYLEHTWRDDRGEVLSVDREGELTLADAQRAARPWLYLHEPELLQETASRLTLADGSVVDRYEMHAVANAEFGKPPEVVSPSPPALAPDLVERLASALPDELLPLTIHLSDYPAWNIPLRGTSAKLSPLEASELEEARAAAVEDRRALYESLRAPIAELIEGAGGRTVGSGWGGGWINAYAPASVVRELLSFPTIRVVHLLDDNPKLGWEMGQGRFATRTGADAFIDAGHHGDQANPDRHGYTTITAAIIEFGLLEDEACFLDDGAGCDATYALAGRYLCDDADNDGNFCEPVIGFFDIEGDNHGTLVASAFLANYRQGQADGFAIGDPAWTSGAHAAAWEDGMTGFAPEARAVYFGGLGPDFLEKDAGLADAFDDAVDLGLDIASSSWGWDSGSSACNPVAEMAHELELENAYDDGLFLPTCSGNQGSASGPCGVWSPGDMLLAYTVAGYSTYGVGCSLDYRDCTLSGYQLGGANAPISGGPSVAGALALIDAVAPGPMTSLTNANGPRGEMTSSDGCSMATPVVAGMAALVKDHRLAAGHTWINHPGRLHTMMLAMTDRHRSATTSGTTQAADGTHKLWGLGRSKMRFTGSGGGLGSVYDRIGTHTYTSSSGDDRIMLWDAPFAAGTDLLKCVLFQRERMSGGKAVVSDIDIVLRTRNPVGGSCVANQGTVVTQGNDLGADTTSMVALEASASFPLAGKCGELDILTPVVTPIHGVTATYYCYSAEISDEDPN